VLWKAPLPGRGPAGPIIVGGRAIVTGSSGTRQDRLHVVCFDAQSGEQLWQRRFWATGAPMIHPFGAVAAPTPASDGRLVFASARGSAQDQNPPMYLLALAPDGALFASAAPSGTLYRIAPDGKATAFSEPAVWEMGLLTPEDWTSKWISAPGSDEDKSPRPAPSPG
jgi:outer membrane protein assembly factor BamB